MLKSEWGLVGRGGGGGGGGDGIKMLNLMPRVHVNAGSGNMIARCSVGRWVQ